MGTNSVSFFKFNGENQYALRKICSMKVGLFLPMTEMYVMNEIIDLQPMMLVFSEVARSTDSALIKMPHPYHAQKKTHTKAYKQSEGEREKKRERGEREREREREREGEKEREREGERERKREIGREREREREREERC